MKRAARYPFCLFGYRLLDRQVSSVSDFRNPHKQSFTDTSWFSLALQWTVGNRPEERSEKCRVSAHQPHRDPHGHTRQREGRRLLGAQGAPFIVSCGTFISESSGPSRAQARPDRAALGLACGATAQRAGLPAASAGSDRAMAKLRCATPAGYGCGRTNIAFGSVFGGRTNVVRTE